MQYLPHLLYMDAENILIYFCSPILLVCVVLFFPNLVDLDILNEKVRNKKVGVKNERNKLSFRGSGD